jgi:hypothetical protein
MKFSKVIITFSALFLLAGAAVASEVKKGDKDKDGHLDKMEAKAFPMLSNHFDIIDTDKDGTIDQAEIDTHKIMMGDKDKDGTVDKSEIKHKGLAKAFDKLDTDKDGTLDAKEVAAFFKK